jgi:ABC-2 type transport system ATP-binding protein
MPDAIVIRGVTKTFGPKVAVSNLDLTISQGTLYGLIGPNGAGKTTTIRMIMSIIFPDKGEISVLGKSSAVESKDRIGYLPEERGLYRKMRVGTFLEYIARLKGMDGRGLTTKVKTWLERLELRDCYRKRCQELSKGMQQKVQVISAVIHEPDLLILDEPFSGLDPGNRRLLRSVIDEQHRAGRTIIFSTHAMYEAEQLCDHLIMINRGRKALDLPMEEVWRRYDPHTVVIEPLDPGKRLEADFAAFPGVIHVAESDGRVELKLADGADPAVLMEAVTRTCRVRRVELKRPSVDAIFIDIVEKSGESEEELRILRADVQASHTEASAAGEATHV